MTKGTLGKDALLSAFTELGLAPTCAIMGHASLSALGVVDGGAAVVVEALREAAGPDGAVIFPSFRGAIREDSYGMRECRAACPAELCPSREPGYTGIVGETVRAQPDSLRSCHPTHSWVGIGGLSRFLLEGHRKSLTPCGEDSPFFRLMECDGKVLLLGVSVRSLTNTHAVEDALNLPYLSATDATRRHATYTTSGRRIQYRYPALLDSLFEEAGLLRAARTGSCLSYTISARLLGSFLWVVTREDPWCWIVRPEGRVYDPYSDACRKVARMARAWRERPDPEGWRRLLEHSRLPRSPVQFEPSPNPRTDCPAYRGVVRDYPRCSANDIPPWERFVDHPRDEPGVATCDQCNWPASTSSTDPV